MALVWVLLLGVFVWRWQRTQSSQLRRFLAVAMAIKLTALLMVVYYNSTNGGGDLVIFWVFKVPDYLHLIETHPDQRMALWGYLLWNDAATDAALQAQFAGQLHQHFNYPNAFEMHYLRLLSLLHFITRGNLTAALFIGSALGLVGQWWVWRALSRKVGRADWLGFLVVFGLASVSIFTAGFHKETFLMLGLGMLMQGLLHNRHSRLWPVIIAVCGWGLMLLIKPYLAFTMLLFLLLVLIWRQTTILSDGRRVIARLSVLAVAVLGVVIFWDTITYTLGYGRYLREVTLQVGAGGGNFVDIGQYDLTFAGLLRAGTTGALVTLFGPLPQHINNLWGWSMLLENLFWVSGVLFLVIRAIRKGLRMRWQPIMWLMIAWSVCYCALLGISVPYYGSLLRYRTIALILLVSGVYLLYATASASKRRA